MPLELSESQRRLMATRLMVQAPPGLTPKQLARWRGDLERRVNGIPSDVLFTLESIRFLAEQGNEVAKALYQDECEKLGLSGRTYSVR